MYRFNHVNGDPYCARLIRDRTGYRLTYPPCGVCGELISLGIVELFHGLHKSEIAFLYKVEEEHSLSDISFCDTYNKSEVCLNKLVLCFFVALCHALRKVKLAIRLKKRNLAYLLQIHPDGVVYRKTLLLEHFFHILGGFELLDLDLPDDVTEYIANRLKTNIRQLEGTVKKIKAFKLLAGSPPSIPIAQNAIRDILNDSQPVSVTVERIINEVSRYFEVSPQDIRSMDRTANVSLARQAAVYIIREITHMSMASIGEEFSNRDHSTIVYTIKQTKATMGSNTQYKNTIEDIIKNIRDQ